MSTQRRKMRLGPAARSSFLEALAAGWTVKQAAERAGFDRRRFYELREDEAFAELWDEALEQGTQTLEDELRRRATEGYDEHTYDGDGNLVRRVRRMHANDLHLLLRARRPDVYRDNAVVNVSQSQSVIEAAPADRSASVPGMVRVLVECGALEIAAGMLAKSGVPLDALDEATADVLRRHVQSGGVIRALGTPGDAPTKPEHLQQATSRFNEQLERARIGLRRELPPGESA